jgi:hypothetical protein
MYCYEFEVIFWDDEEKRKEEGYVNANKYTDAVKHIVDYYDDATIEHISIHAISEYQNQPVVNLYNYLLIFI